MSFPFYNANCSWWANTSNPYADPADANTLCQQLKPLIGLNDYQAGLYKNELVFRFAVQHTNGIESQDIPGGWLGIQAVNKTAIYAIHACQTVNDGVSPRYHYMVGHFDGFA